MHPKLLFSSANAARAAQSLKAREWTQLEVVDLVLTLKSHGNFTDLQEPGAKLINGLLPTLSNPLFRTICFDAGVTECVSSECLQHTFVSTGDYELAASNIGLNGKIPSILGRLLETKECGELQQGKLTARQWCIVFEFALRSADYSLAKHLWQHKSHLSDIPLSAPMYLRLAELVGSHRDAETMQSILKSSGTNAESSSSSASACLNCFTNWRELLWVLNRNHQWLAELLIIQDARNASDVLARNLREVLAELPTVCPALIGNLILQGVYRQNTSQTVLHTYRLLVEFHQFQGDGATAQILANAAFRLGNSKLLSYEIWQELQPKSRKFHETWLMCQLVGDSYTTALFVLAEMARSKIVLRKHIQRMLYNKFNNLGNTTPLLDITKPGFTSKYSQFDRELALSESHEPVQALANANCFTQGFRDGIDKYEVLDQMLQFDARRKP